MPKSILEEFAPGYVYAARAAAIVFPPARVLDIVLPDNGISIFKGLLGPNIDWMLDIKQRTRETIAQGCIKAIEFAAKKGASNAVSLAIAYLGVSALESATGIKVIPQEISAPVNHAIDLLGQHNFRTEYLDVVKLSLGWQVLKIGTFGYHLSREIYSSLKEDKKRQKEDALKGPPVW